jgi:hypothetical protein
LIVDGIQYLYLLIQNSTYGSSKTGIFTRRICIDF